MPSVKNPNKPSHNRLAAQAATARKKQQQRSAAGKKSTIAKSDTRRGARTGILPTSGPRAAVSSKKQRKLERKLGYALKRKMEAEGEVEMKDASDSKPSHKSKPHGASDDPMKLDIS